MEKYKDTASKLIVEKILQAPNEIYAAVMMKMEGLCVSKGDFNRIFDKLATEKSEKFVEIGKKLALLKTGFLLKKGK